MPSTNNRLFISWRLLLTKNNLKKKQSLWCPKMFVHPFKIQNYSTIDSSMEVFLLLEGCRRASSSSINGVPKSLSPASPIPGRRMPSSRSSLSTVPTVNSTSGCVLAIVFTPSSLTTTEIMWIFETPHCASWEHFWICYDRETKITIEGKEAYSNLFDKNNLLSY